MPFPLYPAVAGDPTTTPDLPVADSDEPLDVPVTMAVSLEVLADWIAWLRVNGIYFNPAAPDIQGPINVVGNLSTTADLAVGDDLTITDDAAVGGDLTVAGTTTITGITTIVETLDVQGVGQTNVNGVLAVGIGIETAELQVTVDASVSGSLTHAETIESNLIDYRTDANHTLDVNSASQRIVMTTPPAANRILTLKQTGPTAPPNGFWFEVTVFIGTSAFTVGLQREGSLDYVAVLGDGVGSPDSGTVATVRVMKVAGVWRLAAAGGAYAFANIDS